MQKKVADFIDQHALLQPNERVLVAVSGGMDSVVLTDILVKLGYDCVLAHCNFHLRDADSDRDALFVEQLAENYGLSFRRIDFDTEKIAKQRKISIEMAARDLRYAWFEEIRQNEDCATIAVAHHANDSAETVLLNLTRGTGINGLCGILPKNGKIIRPLLCSKRDEIAKYATENELQFCTDKTNDDTKFRRNFVRHEIVPRLENLNPNFVETVAENARYLTDVKTIYETYLAEIRQKICTQTDAIFTIDTQELQHLPTPQTILFELLRNFGFNKEIVQSIFLSINGLNGKSFLSGNYEAVIERGKIVVKLRAENDKKISFSIDETESELTQPIHLKIEKLEAIPEFEKNPNIAYFDAEKLQFPLTLRHWQEGDTFVPFGMNGHKKVSDFFVDEKFSRHKKNETWFLISGNEILWIVGHRADNRFRVTKSTKNIIRLTFFSA